jgi:AAA domain, putative AbiEii toxin, Type IV TA system
MMYLNKVTLTNVWGVADVSQRINLKPFTVLTGQTDVGLLSEVLQQFQKMNTFPNSEINAFRRQRVQSQIEYQLTEGEDKYYYTLRTTGIQMEREEQKLLPQSNWQRKNRDFWMNAFFLMGTGHIRGAEAQFISDLMSSGSEGFRQECRDQIRAFLPDVEEIEPSTWPSTSLWKGGVKMDLLDLTLAERRLIALAVLLVQRPSLFFIEDLEAGLDPLLLLKVLSYLKEASLQGTQVILTTQSPWLLDAVDLESVVVTKTLGGQTVFSPLQDEVYQSDPRVLPGGRYLEFLRLTNP